MDEASPLQDMYDRPGFLLKRCAQLAVGIFVNRCSEFNLTPSQYGALRTLSAYPGIDQIALGRLIGLDRSTVGLVIRLLMERKLIEREVNVQDKRRMRLRLSPAGSQFLAEVTPVAQQVQEEAMAVLPQVKRELLLSLLREFIEGHGATIAPAEIVAACTPLPAAKPRPIRGAARQTAPR